MLSSFAHIVGNEEVKRYLVRMIERQAVPSSLLFAGPEGVGKSLFAEAFAKLLIGTETSKHPDIRVFRPEGKIGMHSIDSMRRFSEEVYLQPYQSDWKVFIIHDADRMLTYSANALLKTFEEPASQSIIILLSSSSESLLPTVLSRCRTIRFQAIPSDRMAPLEEGQDILRIGVLGILSKGKMKSYSQLMEAAEQISLIIENRQQQLQESAKEAGLKQYPEGMTSVQQQALDKEVDGLLSMCLAREAHAVFDIILSWYRDMHLLKVHGNPDYLFHPDFRDAIDQVLQRGEILSIEEVQKAIAQARLTMERSTPLCNSLENMFLQLSFL